MHTHQKINKLLGQIYNPNLPSISPGLERIYALLDSLGNPHERIPPVIHVAGTNGKGSVCANLATIYQHAGLKVHRYTSPHLVSFNERITIQGRNIDDDLLLACLQEVVPHIEKHPVTFFEATTAAAFLAFSKIPADICILEVGLGGRLDATNVIEKPLLTIITPVGYDHQEFLGNDIREIAHEKAGILKEKVPCVVAKQIPQAELVIRERADKLQAPLWLQGDYWDVEGFTYQSERKLIVFDSSLVGQHQLQNAGISLASVEVLNRLKQWDISAKEGSKALMNVNWPGRLQQVIRKKEKTNIWIDGAHNIMGAQALSVWIKEQERPITMAFGMLENRNLASFVDILAPLCDRVIAVKHFTEAPTHSAEAIEAEVKKYDCKFDVVDDVEDLLKTVDEDEGTTLITGSLYLAGAVLAELE